MKFPDFDFIVDTCCSTNCNSIKTKHVVRLNLTKASTRALERLILLGILDYPEVFLKSPLYLPSDGFSFLPLFFDCIPTREGVFIPDFSFNKIKGIKTNNINDLPDLFLGVVFKCMLQPNQFNDPKDIYNKVLGTVVASRVTAFASVPVARAIYLLSEKPELYNSIKLSPLDYRTARAINLLVKEGILNKEDLFVLISRRLGYLDPASNFETPVRHNKELFREFLEFLSPRFSRRKLNKKLVKVVVKIAENCEGVDLLPKEVILECLSN